MFSGEERITVKTDLPVEQFDKRLCQALDRFGHVEVTDGGKIDIRASGSLASFLSTVTLSGSAKQTDGGYKVTVRYALFPSTACWVVAVVLLCPPLVGAAI